MERVNWSSLVRQIMARRAGKALFFKPVCVIAAVDLADEGLIKPDAVDAEAVLNRFSDYITPFFPDRGRDGFQPLWHLSNDRFWTFFKGDRALNSKEFSDGKPGTKARLFSRFDRLAIHDDLRRLWDAPEERRALRDAMLLMLKDSDMDSRRLVAPLFDPNHLLDRNLWPSKDVLSAYFERLSNQPHLFEDDALDAWPRNDRHESSPAMPNAGAMRSTPLPPAPDAIENVPSPVDYVWANARIVVGPNQANQPVFPFVSSERDHVQRLEACAVQAADIMRDLERQNWQLRDDYRSEIKRYLERLPKEIGTGNILLADAAARILREMFAAEHVILPAPFAARLKTLLQQHIALRPFYPEINNFYSAVRTGQITAPLPLDAVDTVIAVVRDQTPTVFDASVSNAIEEASSSEPKIAVVEADVTQDDAISPPPDPLGELDHTKAHDFQVAGTINRLWKIFKAGEHVHSSAEAWIATYRSLSGPVTEVLDWLHRFLGR